MPRTVAVYGKHLLMSTIGASLQGKLQFQLQQFEGLLPDISELPNTACPDVILFDLDRAPADFAMSVLRKHPMTVLIGVDLMNNKMLVLSGEQSRLMTADDLLQVIEGGVLSVSPFGGR
jgi:hypothetical protein